MDIFKLYATDVERENKGTWVKLGGKARIKVARVGNRAYVTLFQKLVEENAEALEAKDDAAEALADDMMAELYAKTILLDFEGMDEAGVPTAYSYEAAKRMLLVKDFRQLVKTKADAIENFRVKQEEAQGNA